MDLDAAIEFAVAHRIPRLDIRAVEDRNVILESDDEIRSMAARIHAAGLSVSCYCSPLLKWPKPGVPVPDGANFHGYDPDALPPDRAIERAFIVADLLGAPAIRIFSYLAYDGFAPEDLDPDLDRLLDLAARHDKLLLLENEFVCNLKSLDDLAAVVTRYRSKRLQLAADPCNQVTVGLGQPSNMTLSNVARRVGALHLKDVDRDGRYVPLGQGVVENDRAIEQVLAHGGRREIPLVLETHMPESGAEATAAALAWLRRQLEAE